jgi:hypothetical protein
MRAVTGGRRLPIPPREALPGPDNAGFRGEGGWGGGCLVGWVGLQCLVVGFACNNL